MCDKPPTKKWNTDLPLKKDFIINLFKVKDKNNSGVLRLN